MFIYMKVSNDKYQLPVAVADTAKELAEICNTTANNIYSHISKNEKGIYKKVVYIKVEIEEG